MEQVSSTRKLLSASALMAAGTMVSRILGLVRVMLIAFILGNGTRQADMLSVATMVPNSLYILFAGGALNTVLVPQIVRAIKNDPDGGEAYTNRIMTAFMLIVGVVAVVVTLAAPLVTSLYASQYRAPELAAQFQSMVALTYLTLPQIFFYGAFFLLAQVLNARDKFGPMMWAPIANNLISVLVLGIYLWVFGTGGDHMGAFTPGQVWLLGLGSTVGIAAQTAVLIPYLRKVGFRLQPRFDLRGTGLGKTFSLTKWTLGFVAVNQVALVIVTNLSTSATAAGAGAGANAYSNAHLIWILPHSLITVSLATAMLPNASRLAASGNLGGVAEEAMKTVRLALVALVPAAIGFFALAGPISGLLFGHGTGRQDAGWVAWTLMGFAVGLVPFTVQFVCLRTFYALENTRTPFFLQCVIAAANAGLAVLLVWLVRDPGWVAGALALSYSLAYLLGVFLSWRALKSRVPALDGNAVLMHVLRLVLGAGLGGVAAYYLSILVLGWLPHQVWGNALAIVAGLAVIGAVYLLVGKLLKVRELRSLGELVTSRLGRRGARAAQASPDLVDDMDAVETTGTIPVYRDDAPAPARSLVDDLMPTQPTPTVGHDEPDDDGFRRPDLDIDPDPDDPWTYARTPEPSAPEDIDEESLLETRIRPAIRLEDEAHDEGDDADPDAVSVDPATDPDAEATVAGLGGAPVGSAGLLLSTRYRLDELLASRDRIETWRAHDLVLSRDVVCHLLAVGDERVADILEAARKGATATDSRFLRVLDAVPVDRSEVPIGAYVVCEFAQGKSLTQLLAAGPLSALESAWVTRELADALTSMHAQGLFHEHLNPDNVIITTSGAVRLVGFGVESAIEAAGDRPESWTDREAVDVRGLAKLLYATLVRRWPGQARFGLEAAPVIAGEPAPAHTVSGAVSPALDRIASATLTERGAAGETRITTASQLATALGAVLGTADASSDLEHRVRRPATAAPDLPPVHQQLHWAARREAEREQQTVVGVTDGPRRERVVEAAPSDRTRPGRPGLWVIAALAIGTLVVSLIVVAVNNARDNGAATPAATTPGVTSTTTGQQQSPGTTPPGGGITISSVKDFDPEADGGSGDENPADVPKAFDGNPGTGWPTMRYKNKATMGGQKPGVGLVIDLGEARSVSAVEVLFAAKGSTVELRVPADPDAATAPMKTESEWKVVATQADAPVTTTLTPTAPVTSRFVMVYLTKLPEISEARYLATINELVVKG